MREAKEPIRTLLVTSGDKSADALRAMLDPRVCVPIELARSCSDARQKLLGGSFGLVIINAPLSDESGCRLASDISTATPAGVILLVKGELSEQVTAATAGDGVITLSKPVSRAQVTGAVGVLAAVLAKLGRYETEKRELLRKLDEMRVTCRAKCLVMEKLGFSEEAAHRYLEKQAMDNRMTRMDLAKSLIRMFAEE